MLILLLLLLSLLSLLLCCEEQVRAVLAFFDRTGLLWRCSSWAEVGKHFGILRRSSDERQIGLFLQVFSSWFVSRTPFSVRGVQRHPRRRKMRRGNPRGKIRNLYGGGGRGQNANSNSKVTCRLTVVFGIGVWQKSSNYRDTHFTCNKTIKRRNYYARCENNLW